MTPAARRAFTLIELLVVITIIVILLALLAPALDQAIYQAELTVCMTRLKGLATGVQTYAVDFKRAYPDRPFARGQAQTTAISYHGLSDTRPLLRPYISINGHLICPLTPAKVDFEGSKSDTGVYAAYYLFFGAQFQNEANVLQQGMFRLGDRFGWEGASYNALAVDYDEIAPTYGVAYSGHPDWEGLATPDFYQDKMLLVFGNYTLTRWAYFTTFRRPPIDTQYVLDDGSVGRYDQVTWDEAEATGQQRMAKAPGYTSSNAYSGGAGQWIHIPKR